MNRIINIILLAVVAGVISTSCTVEHTIEFDKDMSGNMSLSLNMQDMLKELRKINPDTSKTDAQLLKETKATESIIELKEEFEQANGISNFKSIENFEEGVIGFSFEFDEVEAINKGIKESASKNQKNKEDEVQLFTISKNKMHIDFGNEKEEVEEGNPLAGFELGEYVLTFKFPFPVKSVNNDLYTISKDKKTVQLNIELVEMMQDYGKLRADISW